MNTIIRIIQKKLNFYAGWGLPVFGQTGSWARLSLTFGFLCRLLTFLCLTLLFLSCTRKTGASAGTGDSDGDGILDGADSCRLGVSGWTSNAQTDFDGDGCRDSDEDSFVDRDKDGWDDRLEALCQISLDAGDGFASPESKESVPLDADGDKKCDEGGVNDKAAFAAINFKDRLDEDDDGDDWTDKEEMDCGLPEEDTRNKDVVPADHDGDAILGARNLCDHLDPDDDNDDWTDEEETDCGLQAAATKNEDVVPADHDGDAILGARNLCDHLDPDDDNDGWTDDEEIACGLPEEDTRNKDVVPADHDGDAILGARNLCDHLDPDDDNDGKNDNLDACDPDASTGVNDQGVTLSNLDWTSDASTDKDSDGCQDADPDNPYEHTATSNDEDKDDDNDGVLDISDVDRDNDGLIEIRNLTDLDNVRNDLKGNSRHDGTDSVVAGAPGSERPACAGRSNVANNLCGYELDRPLDFYNKDFSDEVTACTTLDNRTPDYTGDDYCALDNTGSSSYYDSTTGWEPLGNGPGDSSFTGIFEGNGFSIKNLHINQVSGLYFGLFGHASAGASFRNVGLEQLRIHVDVSSEDASVKVGGLLGYTYDGNGTSGVIVLNSYTTGSLEVYGANVNTFDVRAGGLVGSSSGEIKIFNSYSKSKVDLPGGGSQSAFPYAGGLVGYTESISGVTSKIDIINSYATGSVTASNAHGARAHAGGLVASSSANVLVQNSYATGDVTSSATNGTNPESYSGGILARASGRYDFKIVKSYYALGTVEALSPSSPISGGLIGGSEEGTNNRLASVEIENSYVRGTVKTAHPTDGSSPGNSYAGGLLAKVTRYARIEIEGSYMAGTITTPVGNGVTADLNAGTGYYEGGLIAWYGKTTGVGSGTVSLLNSYCIDTYSCLDDDILVLGTNGELELKIDFSLTSGPVETDDLKLSEDDFQNTATDATVRNLGDVYSFVNGEYPSLKLGLAYENDGLSAAGTQSDRPKLYKRTGDDIYSTEDFLPGQE